MIIGVYDSWVEITSQKEIADNLDIVLKLSRMIKNVFGKKDLIDK